MSVTQARLSVVIPTYNSARTLEMCLSAVAWTDEVLVVDNLSNDATPDICRKFPNCRYIPFATPYPFVALNHGFNEAKGEWIIRIDSDQVLTPELSREVRSITGGAGNSLDGYYVSCSELIFGKWIYHVWGERRRPQRDFLFRKGMMWFEDCKREHELPAKRGQWGFLNNALMHYGSPSVADFLHKTNLYTDKDIRRMSPGEARGSFRWRSLFIRPARTFLTLYVRNQGFRDGAHGLMLSILVSVYSLVEQIKLWELAYQDREKEQP